MWRYSRRLFLCVQTLPFFRLTCVCFVFSAYLWIKPSVRRKGRKFAALSTVCADVGLHVPGGYNKDISVIFNKLPKLWDQAYVVNSFEVLWRKKLEHEQLCNAKNLKLSNKQFSHRCNSEVISMINCLRLHVEEHLDMKQNVLLRKKEAN